MWSGAIVTRALFPAAAVSRVLLQETSGEAEPRSTISLSPGSYTFSWAKGVVLGHTYVTGTNLITQYQKIYGTGVLLGDGVLIGDGVAAVRVRPAGRAVDDRHDHPLPPDTPSGITRRS